MPSSCRRFLLLVTVALVSLPALARGGDRIAIHRDGVPNDPQAAPRAGERVALHRETLPNGLQVVVAPLPWARLVDVDVYYAAGAAAEPDSLAGLAHLAEHLLMESAGEFPDGELARRLALYAAYSNASTSGATMRFTNECLPVFLPEILRNEAARMGGARVDALEFERERRVIREELAYRVRLSPWSQYIQDLFRSAYPGHALARSVGGNASTLARIRLDDYVDFVDRHLRPDCAVLVISGPVDADATLAAAREMFAFGPAAAPRRLDFAAYPAAVADQWIDDSSDFEGFRLGIACRIPLRDSRDLALAAALREFLREAEIDAVAWPVPGEYVLLIDGLWIYSRPPTDPTLQWGYIYPDFNPDQNAQRALTNLWQEIGEMIDEMGSGTKYAERRDEVLETLGRRSTLESLVGFCGPALLAGMEPLAPDSLRELVAALEGSQLQEFAARYLTPERSVVGVRHGKDSERMATIDLAKRVAHGGEPEGRNALDGLGRDRIEPVLAAYRAADLFPVERYELENGVPVLQVTVPEGGRWRLAGQRTFPPLKELGPRGKPGLDALYNRVVEYGKTERDLDEDTVRPLRRPFNLSVELSPCRLLYGADGSADKAEKIAATVSTRLRSDEFNSARWSRVLEFGRHILTRLRDDPAYCARTWRRSRLLGPDHAGAADQAVDPSLTETAGYKDLQKLHGKTARKVGNTVLVVAGPLPRRENEALLSEEFAGMGERSGQKFPHIEPVAVEGPRGRVFPDLEAGDVVVSIAFGPVDLDELGADPGAAVLLLEEVLGERLSARLREQMGLTYHADCRAHAVGGAVVWEARATGQPGQAPLLWQAMDDELSRIARDGFSPDEWARARLSLAAATISDFADPDGAVDWLLRLCEFGEPGVNPPQEVLTVREDAVAGALPAILDAGRRVFTAVGPMFEEDIDQFRRAAD